MSALHSSHFLKRSFKRGIRNRYLYTPQHKILSELKRRRARSKHTEHLLEKIKPTPELSHLLEKPHLIFFRQVVTPLHETLRVLDLASQLKLDLCIIEYHHDKFVGSNNQYKLGLGKLPIHQFVDKRGDDIFKNKTIVDFNSNTGKSLANVNTITGERLIDFHHDFFTHQSGLNIKTISVDASDWFGQFSHSAQNYYEAFLSLFIQHNVLAEVFLWESVDEENFTNKVVRPAFLNIIQETGLKPLILNSQPVYEQDRLYWDCYPTTTDDFLKERGYIK